MRYLWFYANAINYMEILNTKKPIPKACLLFVMLLIPCLGYSQSIWVQQSEDETIIGVEAKIPAVDGEGADSPSGVLVIYSQIPLSISNGFNLRVNIPSVRFGCCGRIGGPYLGIEYVLDDIDLSVDLGVRLPAYDALSPGFGAVVNKYNPGAFIPEYTTVLINVDYKYETQSGLILRVGGGPHLFVSDGDRRDNELLVKYYGQLLYDSGNFAYGAGFIGIANVVEGNLTVASRTTHSFGLLGSYDFGTLTAGAYFRFPIEGGNQAINYVGGLNLSVAF